jgi:hypothetical protein
VTRFFHKINGGLHDHGSNYRPRTAKDWEGREIMMPWVGPRPSSYLDRAPGPATQPGDDLFVWTHEDEVLGNGLGYCQLWTAPFLHGFS